jgi:hypothetical protein
MLGAFLTGDKVMHVDKAERLIRTELRKKFGPGYRRKFEIRTCENNHAVSVHWHGEPDEPVIEVIGAPLVTGPAGNGLWFFQTHHNE